MIQANAVLPRLWCRARQALLVASSVALLGACGGGGEPTPEDRAAACRLQTNDTAGRLLDCVTPEGLRVHLQALAAIAAAHGGHRASGSPGYAASVDYVARLLREAGYQVTLQPFTFEASDELGPGMLEQRAPAAATIAHEILGFSGSGDIVAPVAQPPGVRGCEAADFTGFVPGHIALIERADCPFATKATHAYQAGAAGVVFYNHVEADEEKLLGTLGAEFKLPLPAVGVSRADGLALAARIPQGLVLALKTQMGRREGTSWNVIAESPSGDPSHVAVLGAHLDSVVQAPGLNDNGSGVAALLETALQMARVQPANQLRFAFWGAEEDDLAGSQHYVETLDPAQRARIALYLNFDMLGSRNGGFFVYSGDGQADDALPARAPAAQALEDVFTRFHAQRGIAWQRMDVSDGRSDHASFAEAGIPFAGVTSGADAEKTPAEAALWGGTVGQWYDGCYHAACDDLGNVDEFLLATHADAVAWAALHFAFHRLPQP